MATKWKNNGQQELFDGKPVEKHRLAFKGNFSAEEVNIDDLGMDDHVCLLVIAEVADAAFTKNNEEEVVRTDKLGVLRAVELDAQVADYALAKQASVKGKPMLPMFEDPDDDPDDTDDDDGSSEEDGAEGGDVEVTELV